ncbi:MAG TPA: PA14 domain-containing protein [Chloroflexota bacterium]|nr:PA14 domain-containing protein [Chloroflexota bacterium]
MRTRLTLAPRGARPAWLSRRLVLAVDALFGVLLLALAVTGGAAPGAPPPPGSSASPAMEVTARLGGASPPGQVTGLAASADGSLALVDRGRSVVIRLDASGQQRAEWGPHFGADLDAQELVGLAADGDGWYVLDRGAQRILRLDSTGQAQPERTIDLKPLTTYGPNGLATDGQGNLYLADTGRDRIVVFDSGGHMTAALGDAGTGLGKFKQPMTLAFGPDDSMFVSDWENSRVQRWSADRQPINAWPTPVHAWGIAVDSLGRVFLPDGDHHLVRMFGSDGTLLAQLGGEGGPPIPVEFPSQVVASPDGSKLWVLGADGLARVDLAPYSAFRPSTGAAAARLPLAALGSLLLVLALAATAWPYRRLISLPQRSAAASVGPSAGVATQIAAEPPSAAPTSSATWRPALGLLLIAVGAFGAIAAELQVADAAARLDPWPKLAALLLASLVFAVGAALTAAVLPWRWVVAPRPCRPDPSRGRPYIGIAGGVATLVLAGIAGQTWWFGRFQTPDAARGALLWFAALAIAAGTLAHYGQLPRLRRDWLTLVPWLLFVVALIPRVWSNADLPFGVWFDEAEAGLQARKFLTTGVFTPITDTYGRDAALFYYLIAAAQALIPDPVLAARLIAAVVGALCAPLVYLLGRELFGWRVGLAAGLLLATSRWHLDVSRLGWDPISLPCCAILAFWLLSRAIRTARRTDAVLAGLAMGLGMHAYIGYRALPVVGFGLLVYAGWRRGWTLHATVDRFILALGGAVLAALPVIVFAIQDPSGFNGRVNQTLILSQPISQADKLDQLWSNVQKHALMFHVSGDMNGRHNLPGLPMVDPLSGLLLVVGLAVLLLRPFDWRSLLLFGWAAVSMAGGIFTFAFEAPQGMRTLGVTPVLALVIALALVLVLDRLFTLAGATRRLGSIALASLGAAAVAWIGFTNISTFFVRQMNDPTVWESFSTRETLPSRAALAAEQPYEAILGSPTIAPSLQQQLMVPTVQRTMRSFDPSLDLPYRGTGPTLIVLETEHDAGLADEVARYYPDARRTPIVPPNGARPTADELLLDASILAAHHGVQASYRGSDERVLNRRESAPVLLADQAPVALPADVAWRTALALDAPGDYAFRVSAGFRLSVDGSDVRDTDRWQLARGNHLLTMSGSLAPGARLELAWQSPASGQTWQTVDSALLFIPPDGGYGLQATFYPNVDFQGPLTETIIDPVLDHYYHINPLARLNLSPAVWSAEWRGLLDVPTTGAYRFEAERLSRAGLWIDEQRVFDDTVDSPSATISGVAQLTAGRHAIRARLQNRGDGGPKLYLYWVPPGGGREILPGRVLYPPLPSSPSSPPSSPSSPS